MRKHKHKHRVLHPTTRKPKQCVYITKHMVFNCFSKSQMWAKELLWLYFCQKCTTKGLSKSIYWVCYPEAWGHILEKPSWFCNNGWRKVWGRRGDLGFVWRTQQGHFPSCSRSSWLNIPRTHTIQISQEAFWGQLTKYREDLLISSMWPGEGGRSKAILIITIWNNLHHSKSKEESL